MGVRTRVPSIPLPVQLSAIVLDKAAEADPSFWASAPTWEPGWSSRLWPGPTLASAGLWKVINSILQTKKANKYNNKQHRSQHGELNPLPEAPTSHTDTNSCPIAPLLSSSLLRARKGSRGWLRCLSPCTRGNPGRSPWVPTSDRPSCGCCGLLVSQTADERSLCLSLY